MRIALAVLVALAACGRPSDAPAPAPRPRDAATSRAPRTLDEVTSFELERFTAQLATILSSSDPCGRKAEQLHALIASHRDLVTDVYHRGPVTIAPPHDAAVARAIADATAAAQACDIDLVTVLIDPRR